MLSPQGAVSVLRRPLLKSEKWRTRRIPGSTGRTAPNQYDSSALPEVRNHFHHKRNGLNPLPQFPPKEGNSGLALEGLHFAPSHDGGNIRRRYGLYRVQSRQPGWQRLLW